MSDEQKPLFDLSDFRLQARRTDPVESHLSSQAIEEREGTTATFTPNRQKHRILAVYAREGRPLTDTQAWRRAGIPPRAGAWHRCSDMLRAGVLEEVGSTVDEETGRQVRLMQITAVGRGVLRRLDAGETVKKTIP